MTVSHLWPDVLAVRICIFTEEGNKSHANLMGAKLSAVVVVVWGGAKAMYICDPMLGN